MEYPVFKHHAKHGAKVVESEEHLKSLGEGWGDDSSVWRPHLLKKEDVLELPVQGDDPLIPEDSKPQAKKGRKAQEKA